MAFSETTEFEVGIVDKSTTWSTSALSAGSETMLAFRGTVDGLNPAVTTVLTEEIDNNAQVVEQRRTIQGMAGDLSGELHFPIASGALQLCIESALRSSFTTLSESQTDISFTSNNQIDSAALADFSTLVAGQKIRVVTTSGTNDGIYTVATSSTLQITTVETTITTENAATAGTVAITGKVIRNANTKKYLAIEKDFGAANKFFHIPAAMATGMNITLESGQIAKVTFPFIGSGIFNTAATIDDDGTYTSAGTASAYDATNHWTTFKEGGAVNSALFIKRMNIQISNQGEGLDACGNSRFVRAKGGELSVNGSYEAYFDDNSIWTKFENDTASSWELQLGSTAGNTMILSLLNLKYTNSSIPAGAKNSMVMGTYTFGGQKHTTYNATFQIDLI